MVLTNTAEIALPYVFASDLEAKANAFESVIEAKDFNFAYGKHQVLYNNSFSIIQSKVTAIIGSSGCGKSTLIRAMNRMNDLYTGARAWGSMVIFGMDIYSRPCHPESLRRNVAMVFQKPNPFPMSIYNNVAYGPKINGVHRKDELNDIVQRSLESAGLWEEAKANLNRSAFNLSGGQQQRLCIARALANDPTVILFDEPCSALDPKATRKVEETIGYLSKELKKTIVIVTHNMHQALRVSDFSIHLFEGKIEESGTTHQLFEAPRTLKTKEYVSGIFG